MFGTDKNYVLSVQNIDDENELVNNFNYFLDNETPIKETLEKQIPNYVLKAKKAKEVINKL